MPAGADTLGVTYALGGPSAPLPLLSPSTNGRLSSLPLPANQLGTFSLIFLSFLGEPPASPTPVEAAGGFSNVNRPSTPPSFTNSSDIGLDRALSVELECTVLSDRGEMGDPGTWFGRSYEGVELRGPFRSSFPFPSTPEAEEEGVKMAVILFSAFPFALTFRLSDIDIPDPDPDPDPVPLIAPITRLGGTGDSARG
jgi:hypothetical protein